MVDSNFYVENPGNSHLHYGDKPIVGVIDFPARLPVNKPYNYFDGESLYNTLQRDIWEQQRNANPEDVKKGVPKIIKYALGAVISIPLIYMGVKGIQKIISKIKH